MFRYERRRPVALGELIHVPDGLKGRGRSRLSWSSQRPLSDATTSVGDVAERPSRERCAAHRAASGERHRREPANETSSVAARAAGGEQDRLTAASAPRAFEDVVAVLLSQCAPRAFAAVVAVPLSESAPRAFEAVVAILLSESATAVPESRHRTRVVEHDQCWNPKSYTHAVRSVDP